MKQVCKAELRRKITRLIGLQNAEFGTGLTLDEQFRLEAYKMLLERLEKESAEREQND